MILVLLYGVVEAWNEIEKIQKLLLRRLLGLQSSISYDVMLLEICAQPIKVLAIHKVFQYITKAKNMPNHKLPKHVEHRMQGTNV